MALYQVTITGKGLVHAREALDRAGVPSLGPAFSGYGQSLDTIGRRMIAVLDAASGEEAEARVTRSLPADGDFTIEAAKPA